MAIPDSTMQKHMEQMAKLLQRKIEDEYRKAFTAANSDPNRAACLSPGGSRAGSFTATQIGTQSNALAAGIGACQPGALIPLSPSELAQIQQLQGIGNLLMGPPFGYPSMVPAPTFKQIEESTPEITYAGLEVGEIVAWRVWRLRGDTLQSVTMKTLWPPGEVMEGDVDKGWGIFAFMTSEDALGCGAPRPSVLGRVALWGEVIEHEMGYRAQFARVLHIDLLNLGGGYMGGDEVDEHVFPWRRKKLEAKPLELLDRLRKRYHVDQEEPSA